MMKAALRNVRPLFTWVTGCSSNLSLQGEDVAQRQEGGLSLNLSDVETLRSFPLCPSGHLPPSGEIISGSIFDFAFLGNPN